MIRTLICTVVIGAALLGVVGTASADPVGPRFAGSKLCVKGYVPNTPNVFGLRVRRGSCTTAKKAVLRFTYSNAGGKIKGWKCRSLKGYYDGGFFRCNRGRMTIQFGQGA